MTDYKSLDATAFDSEVQAKVLLQSGDSIKLSALLNDYEHKLEAEDTLQDTALASAESTVFSANQYIRQLSLHKSYVLDQMILLHDANPNDFSALHMTSEDVIAALNPLVWLNATAENVDSGSPVDGQDIAQITDKAGNATYTIVGSVQYVADFKNGMPGFQWNSSATFYDQNFGVVQEDSTYLAVIETGSDVTAHQYIYRISNTNGRGIYIVNGNLEANGLTIAVTADTKYIVIHTLNRTGNTSELIVQEAGQASQNDTGTAPAVPSGYSILQGAGNTAGAFEFQGKIADAIVLSGSVASEITTVNDYLTGRYDMTVA